MGLFWNLLQHSQIAASHEKADSLEKRVALLEEELARTNDTLVRLLHVLEERFGDDLDGDGRVG